MKKILFIEDEQSLQKTLGDTLAKEGFETASALDGESGLRLAKTENPDLIVCDLILPKISGFDVLKGLKEDQATKKIPVMVLTNLENTEDVEKALSLGATTYLVKTDHTLEDLIGKIRQTLGN